MELVCKKGNQSVGTAAAGLIWTVTIQIKVSSSISSEYLFQLDFSRSVQLHFESKLEGRRD
jgi:hypothetical protein